MNQASRTSPLKDQLILLNHRSPSVEHLMAITSLHHAFIWFCRRKFEHVLNKKGNYCIHSVVDECAIKMQGV